MAEVVLWQRDCPGTLETRIGADGAITVVCLIEDGSGPNPEPPPEEPMNLLRNPGFEAPIVKEDWYSYADAGMPILDTSAAAHTGNTCVQITGGGVGDKGRWISGYYPVKPGTLLSVAGAVWADFVDGQAYIMVLFFDAGKVYLSGVGTPVVVAPGGSNWLMVELEGFSVPMNAALARVELRAWPFLDGVVRFDDIFLGEFTPPGTLEEILLAAGEEHQLIQFNPNAALQKAIFQDGFVPNSDEFDLEYDGVQYRGQRAERLSDGIVRVYYAVIGVWDNIMFVERPV